MQILLSGEETDHTETEERCGQTLLKFYPNGTLQAHFIQLSFVQHIVLVFQNVVTTVAGPCCCPALT